MQWLLTLAPSPPPSWSLADSHGLTFPLERCVEQLQGVSVWTWMRLPVFRGPEAILERNCVVREKGKPLWGFQDGGAGSQEEKHGRLPRLETHSALSEARACTQHRCWKRLGEGIEKKGGTAKKRGKHTHHEELIEWTIMIRCLCWIESCLPLWREEGGW